MSATKLSGKPKLPLPFVGREREAAELLRLNAQHRHVLILGAAGVGKSALVRHVSGQMRLVICEESVRLLGICEALELGLGLEEGQRLVQRKNRILDALRGLDCTVVFDGLGWTTPKVSSFLGCVAERVPIWVVACSEHSWDIGHFWTMLAGFCRVEVKRFHPSETREVIERLVSANELPQATLESVEALHRLSGGSPRVLGELLERLARGVYDLHKSCGLKLLELDRQIEKLPVSLASRAKESG